MSTQEESDEPLRSPKRTIPGVDRIDLKKLGPIYGLQAPTNSSEPDYLKYNIKGRDIGGKIFFNSGLAWLGGFAGAGAYGFAEGWRNAANPSFRVKLNSVMNGISKRGSKAGNALGAIGIIPFFGVDSPALTLFNSIPVHIDIVGCRIDSGG